MPTESTPRWQKDVDGQSKMLEITDFPDYS